jgi:hypothetical protein
MQISRKPVIEEETVTLAPEPFAGVACYCLRCRKERIAPWLPANCPVCKKLMRVGISS